MKKTLIASLLAIATVPMFAHAADGTVNFNGTVVSTTCTPTAASKDQTVALGTISASALTSGQVGGYKTFDISLVNCGATAKTVQLKFKGVNMLSSDNTYLANNSTGASAATNVAVEMINRNNNTTVAANGGSIDMTSSTDGSVTFPMAAQYRAVGGNSTAGAVTAKSEFSIMYP